jgi:A/G-specific adenine glycosylase
VREYCQAFVAGIQERIPVSTPGKPKAVEQRWIIVIRDGSRWLIEQRPPQGRWASMWQFYTLRASGNAPTSALIASDIGLAVSQPRRLGLITHELTHRRYHFEVFLSEIGKVRRLRSTRADGRIWVQMSRLSDYPLPRPHLRVAAMLEGVLA